VFIAVILEVMRTVLVFVGLVLLAVVAGVFMTSSDRGGPAAVTVPFTALAEGSRSEVTSRVNYLIDTQEELARLWDLLQEAPPIPTVDFNTKVVAAVFAGEVPTAGYDIAVTEVEDADDRVVRIELVKPNESCVLAQSVTAPYQVIELPKTSLPFTHADTWTTKPCP